MEMRVIEHSELSNFDLGRSVVTIGNFDGVHRGHRYLFERVVERARVLGALSAVYTFHPHPLKVLNPSFCPPLVTSFEDRVRLIEREGIDVLVWARFDREYAALEPEEFALETLGRRLQAAEVWVGTDFVFGRARRGDLDMLRRLGPRAGFELRVATPLELEGGPVSSTRVRQAVAEADFPLAERLLGRPFTIRGAVVHGFARGRGLGFPTANVLPREECLPPPGVYAAWATFGGERRGAALNIGNNPTFGGADVTVEAFLLDYAGDLYGAEMELTLVAAVRGEIAFQHPTDLMQQIQRDTEAIRSILGLERPPPDLHEQGVHER